MTENQKLALIAAAAPNTALRWSHSFHGYYADDTRHHLEPDSSISRWSGKAVNGLVGKGFLKLNGTGGGWVITEAGRRAVEEMVKK